MNADNNGMGCGSVNQDQEGEEEVFPQHSSIQSTGFRSLNEGDRVELEIAAGPKGLESGDVVKTESNRPGLRPYHREPGPAMNAGLIRFLDPLTRQWSGRNARWGFRRAAFGPPTGPDPRRSRSVPLSEPDIRPGRACTRLPWPPSIRNNMSPKTGR